jgi:hypothetical protein
MIKRVNVYISSEHKQVIIAPLYQTEDGVLNEQDDCIALPYPLESEMLGSGVMGRLEKFYLDQKHPGNISGLSVLDGYRRFHVGETKQSGLAAYKISKAKSAVEFGDSYTYISVYGANESNITLIMEGSPSKDSDLWVKTSISTYAQKDQIGEKILKVYYACMTRKI